MPSRHALLVLLLAGVVIRAGLWLTYEPISHPDTATYFTVAGQMTSRDFAGFEGRRTPGYPSLIALAGLDPGRVFVLQLVFGLAISALLFHLTLDATDRPAFALAVGMSYNLNLAQLFFEANLLSETLSTLVVTGALTLLILIQGRIRERRSVTGALVLLGLLGGWATLVRPQFVFLPPLLAALVAFGSAPGLRLATSRATLVVVPGLALVLGWCAFNYARTGYFTLTTQLGIGLMAHSLPMLDSAPPRYALIRDVYIRYRDAEIAKSGRHYLAVWAAVPELQRVTGLSLPRLSDELRRLSVDRFVRHPVWYGTSVLNATVDFWLAPNYWRLERLHPRSAAVALRWLWRVEHALIRAANATFLLGTLAAMASATFRRRIGWDVTLGATSAIALAACVVAALSFRGENARYAIPVQPLIIAAVMIAGYRWTHGGVKEVTA
jgi:hypothetical protein